MWCLRRASGPTVSRSMNSGSASRSIASSTLSTRKRRPTGCPIPVCAKPPIPPIVPSSGSICSTISVAKPPVCWEARQVARISPSCALSFPRPPFRRSPVKCGTRMTASRRTKRLQGTVRLKASDEHSNDKPPFQLGRCHALRFDGEAVRQFYPRWYGHAPRSAERADTASEQTRHAAGNGNGGGTSRLNDSSGNEVQSNSQTEGNHA